MMSLLILIFEFFKIGLFSIGGGLATLPFLYRLADKYPWFSAKQIPDMIAVSESTPPLGINMATYGLSAQRRYRKHCGDLWLGTALGYHYSSFQGAGKIPQQ